MTINITEATIAKLDLKPSDVIVVTLDKEPHYYDGSLSSMIEEVKKNLLSMSIENKVMIVSGCTLSVMSKEEADSVPPENKIS